jgi:translation initiation factor eIF-2B subunit delta
MKTLAARIEAIRRDRVHGASELVCQALEIMKTAAADSQAGDAVSFLRELQNVAQSLSEARPSMTALATCLDGFIGSLRDGSQETRDLEPLRAMAVYAAAAMAENVSQAKERAALHAASMIRPGAVVVTCSYSSTLISVLTRASSTQTFDVLMVRTEDAHADYAGMMASQLKNTGLHCRLVTQNSLEGCLPGADFILLGSDSVLEDGSIINGSPSLFLAQAAAGQNPRIPVYAVCESTKFHRGGAPFLEPGFDLIPSHLLAGIIMEDGLIGCAQVANYLR